MGEEEKARFRRDLALQGEPIAIKHEAQQTSAVEGSKAPWKSFLEAIDGDGQVPGLVYYVDSTGQLKRHWMINTSAVMPVTEASGATIAGNVNYVRNAAWLGSNPYYGTPDTSDQTISIAARYRIGQLLLTTDGAGACAATTAVAALAGYTGHIEILGSWSADSGATTPTITIACTAGTAIGITAIQYTSASYQPVTLGFGSCGLYARGTVAADDNKNITISMAGGGATKNYYITYKYWYET